MELVTYGTILKNRIKECGYTQEEFAEKSGIGLSTLRKQIKGTIAYRYDDLIKYAELLDCSYDYLLGYSKSPNRESADIVDKTGLSDEAVNNLILGVKLLNGEFDGKIDLQQEKMEAKWMVRILNEIICDEQFLRNYFLYCGGNKIVQKMQDEAVEMLINSMSTPKEEQKKFKDLLMPNMDRIMFGLFMGDVERIKSKVHDELLDSMRDDVNKVRDNLKAIRTQSVVKANE